MRYKSIREIIGPVMVGPSSSHTAGAVRIGQMAREIFGSEPEAAEITFYGSFAHTYQGHGTDVALIAGLLGLSTFDHRIPEAFQLARQAGLGLQIIASEEPSAHPNTARIVLHRGKREQSITGISIGGGSVEIVTIDEFRVRLSGEGETLLIFHEDRPGTIASVTELLAQHGINISHMEDSRLHKLEEALMTLQADSPINKTLLRKLRELPSVHRTIHLRQD